MSNSYEYTAMPAQTGVVTGVWRARPSPPNEDEVEMIEHKIKVERRQLEFLLTAPEFVSKDGVHVLQQIAQRHGVHSIGADPKLKIGAKSKKHPTLRILADRGQDAEIDAVVADLEELMNTKKRNSITLRVELPKDQHFFAIGKKGEHIKEVMAATGCHIHFPDTQRNAKGHTTQTPPPVQSSSKDQVSIAGLVEQAEHARHMIRGLLPITISFSIPEGVPADKIQMTEEVTGLARELGVTIFFKQRVQNPPLALVKGPRKKSHIVEKAVFRLLKLLTGGRHKLENYTLQVDIPSTLHGPVIGTNGCNIRKLMALTDTVIRFPEASKSSAVFIAGRINQVKLTHAFLQGLSPFIITFEVSPEQLRALSAQAGALYTSVEDYLKRCEDGLPVTVSTKLKATTGIIYIKTIEAMASSAYAARMKVLSLLGERGDYGMGALNVNDQDFNLIQDDPQFTQLPMNSDLIRLHGEMNDALGLAPRPRPDKVSFVGNLAATQPRASKKNKATASAATKAAATTYVTVSAPPSLQAAPLQQLNPGLPKAGAQPVTTTGYVIASAAQAQQLAMGGDGSQLLKTETPNGGIIYNNRLYSPQPAQMAAQLAPQMAPMYVSLSMLDGMQLPAIDGSIGPGGMLDPITQTSPLFVPQAMQVEQSAAIEDTQHPSSADMPVESSEVGKQKKLGPIESPVRASPRPGRATSTRSSGHMAEPTRSGLGHAFSDLQDSGGDSDSQGESGRGSQKSSLGSSQHMQGLSSAINAEELRTQLLKSSLESSAPAAERDANGSGPRTKTKSLTASMDLRSDETSPEHPFIGLAFDAAQDHKEEEEEAKAAVENADLDSVRIPNSYWSGRFLSHSMTEVDFSKLKFAPDMDAMRESPSPVPSSEATLDDGHRSPVQLVGGVGSVSPDEPHMTGAELIRRHQEKTAAKDREQMTQYWNVTTVDQLLLKLKMDGYVKLFQEQEIDLPTLLMLESSDLNEIGVKAFGARKKILLAIAELKKMRNSDKSFLASIHAFEQSGGAPSRSPSRKIDKQSPDSSPLGKPPSGAVLMRASRASPNASLELGASFPPGTGRHGATSLPNSPDRPAHAFRETFQSLQARGERTHNTGQQGRGQGPLLDNRAGPPHGGHPNYNAQHHTRGGRGGHHGGPSSAGGFRSPQVGRHQGGGPPMQRGNNTHPRGGQQRRGRPPPGNNPNANQRGGRPPGANLQNIGWL